MLRNGIAVMSQVLCPSIHFQCPLPHVPSCTQEEAELHWNTSNYLLSQILSQFRHEIKPMTQLLWGDSANYLLHCHVALFHFHWLKTSKHISRRYYILNSKLNSTLTAPTYIPRTSTTYRRIQTHCDDNLLGRLPFVHTAHMHCQMFNESCRGKY